ncbi:tRNA (adenosine(37)-N6)-dimethylallyltransferase MiaA [Geothermobacter ehrlichii]|nr:tRNA (adenosine(37)-N6)-dimethylallyltransferase MiaA [Geothermobacter ehrlichii]
MAAILQPLIVVCGPTACGKTDLCLRLAGHFDLEIVSADSRQVYRTMDIGTAKPEPAVLERVRHHLVDVVDPDEDFTVAHFVEQGRRAIEGIRAASRLPVLAGGTGLYIQALTEGLADVPPADPAFRQKMKRLAQEHGNEWLLERLKRVDPVLGARLRSGDQVRIIRALEVFEQCGRPLSEIQRRHGFSDRPYRLLKIGLAVEREELYRRIELRTEAMFAAGLVDEVRALLDRGYDPALKALNTIGYREVIGYLQGRHSLQEAIERVKRNTRRYAKRQLTWFRRDESINWVDPDREFAKITELIAKFNVP